MINGLTHSHYTGTFGREGTGGIPVLTDGLFPPITRADDGGEPFELLKFTATALSSVTYTLLSPSNITAINVFGGWQDQNRDQQAFIIEYTTSTNSSFTELTSVNYDPPVTGAPKPVATFVGITDTTGTLLENVTSIRFTFGDTENGYTGYGEIDVIGTAVPEPSAAALLGVGLLGALRRRR